MLSDDVQTTSTTVVSVLADDLRRGPVIGRVASPVEAFLDSDLSGDSTPTRVGLPGASTDTAEASVLVVDAVPGAVELLLPDLERVWVAESDVEAFRAPVRLFVDIARGSLRLEDSDGIMTMAAVIGPDVAAGAHGELYVAELLRPPDPVQELWGEVVLVMAGSRLTPQNLVTGERILAITGQKGQREGTGEVLPGEVALDPTHLLQVRDRVPLGTPVEIRVET